MTAQLKDKIQNATDESRTLVLGAEILVGFDFTAVFQEGFKRLSRISQVLNFVGLVLMLVTLILLIAPASFHQLTEKGEDAVSLHQFTTRLVEWALCPFALSLGSSAYIPAEQVGGGTAGVIFGVSTAFVAILSWYGPMLLRRGPDARRRLSRSMTTPSDNKAIATPLNDKIRQALTEARMIIPGNQALLGFQFAIILQQGFRELASWLRWVHLGSLAFIAASTVLLLTPAAYHRIVENGEETEGFYRVTSAMVLWSLPPLALGISGDFFLVTYQITGKFSTSLASGALILSLFGGLWIGYPVFRRNHRNKLVRQAA